MSVEDILSNYTKPSSATEADKQERTVRMIKEAIDAHNAFDACSLNVFAKGSYANNTNVKVDSDVDVAVECTEVEYYKDEEPGTVQHGDTYKGIWTPSNLRSQLQLALTAKFGDQVDSSGDIAIGVNSSSARIDADVVPSFTYCYYFRSGRKRCGTKIFRVSGSSFKNYPNQQMENGENKNVRTNYGYKKAVRILKRVSNALYRDGKLKDLPSYFIECLVYNCPDGNFSRSTWTDVTKANLVTIWNDLEGLEPSSEQGRWVEVNESIYLFHGGQKWTREEGRTFAKEAWNYLELS